MPSVRRGATNYLAQMKMALKQIQSITGHKRIETLRRYLGYGLQPTKDDETVQALVEQILLTQTQWDQ